MLGSGSLEDCLSRQVWGRVWSVAGLPLSREQGRGRTGAPFLLCCSSDDRKTFINSPTDRFLCFSQLPWIQRYCHQQKKKKNHCFFAIGLEEGGCPAPAQAAPRGSVATGSPCGHDASVILAHEGGKPFILHSSLLQPFLPIQHIALTGLIKRTSIFLKSRRNL